MPAWQALGGDVVLGRRPGHTSNMSPPPVGGMATSGGPPGGGLAVPGGPPGSGMAAAGGGGVLGMSPGPTSSGRGGAPALDLDKTGANLGMGRGGAGTGMALSAPVVGMARSPGRVVKLCGQSGYRGRHDSCSRRAAGRGPGARHGPAQRGRPHPGGGGALPRRRGSRAGYGTGRVRGPRGSWLGGSPQIDQLMREQAERGQVLIISETEARASSRYTARPAV